MVAKFELLLCGTACAAVNMLVTVLLQLSSLAGAAPAVQLTSLMTGPVA